MAPGPSTGAAAASLAVGFLVQGLWNRGVGSAPSSAVEAGEAIAAPSAGFGVLDLLKVLLVGALFGALGGLWLYHRVSASRSTTVNVAVDHSTSVTLQSSNGDDASEPAPAARRHIPRRGKGRLESGGARPTVPGLV